MDSENNGGGTIRHGSMVLRKIADTPDGGSVLELPPGDGTKNPSWAFVRLDPGGGVSEVILRIPRAYLLSLVEGLEDGGMLDRSPLPEEVDRLALGAAVVTLPEAARNLAVSFLAATSRTLGTVADPSAEQMHAGVLQMLEAWARRRARETGRRWNETAWQARRAEIAAQIDATPEEGGAAHATIVRAEIAAWVDALPAIDP